MSARLLFRIVAGILLLFAAGHTFGFLSFVPWSTEGRAVWQAMQDVHFSDANGTYSYGRFYTGFGLDLSALMLFEAWLVWHLGAMVQRGSVDAAPIAWALCLVQLLGLGLSIRYFSIPPAMFSLLAALLLGFAALRAKQSARLT